MKCDAIGPRFTTLVLSALAGLLLAGGCGGGSGAKPTSAPDEQKLRGLITAVRESAESAAQFKPLFVDGAVPGDAERQRFRKYTFDIKPPANVSGDEATVTVTVRSLTGAEIGESQWTAVRSGTEWKLKTAPLPAGD